MFYSTAYDSWPKRVKLLGIQLELLGQGQIITSLSKEESSIKELPLRGNTEEEDLIMLKPEIFIWYDRHLQLLLLKCDKIENHSKPLMFHMRLWVKDEPDPISLYSHVIYTVNKDLEVINHLVPPSSFFSGVTVLFTEHIVSTEGAALNEFLLAI